MKTTEDTLVIIKNDTIKRGLVGEIIQKFEHIGLKIVGMKMVVPKKELAVRHYSKDDAWKLKVGKKIVERFTEVGDVSKLLGTSDPLKLGTKVYNWSIEQLCEGEVIVMALRGADAIEKVKKVTGIDEPAKADLSTIRGIYSGDSFIKCNIEKRALYNVVHRSTSKEEAKREIEVWFSM